MLKNLTIKQKFLVLYVALLLIFLMSGTLNYLKVRDNQREWKQYLSEVAIRQKYLLDIRAAFGYVGGIHHFKNLLLRKDSKYAVDSRIQFNLVFDRVNKYLKLSNISQIEHDALSIIKVTAEKYFNNISIIIDLQKKRKAINYIDRIVKIDDQPALMALEALHSEYEKLTSKRTESFTTSLSNLFFTLLGSLIVAFFILLLFTSWIGNNIVRGLKETVKFAKSIGHGNMKTSLNVTPSKDEVGILIFTMKQMQADLIKTQAQLIQSAKLASLGEMSSGLAHELNNPLFFVIGFNHRIEAALKKHGTVSEKEIGEHIKCINDGATRMKAIIQHFREFSRQTEHKLDLVNLNEVIESSFSLLSKQFKLKNIEIKMDLCKESIFVAGDKIRLEQVFVNFLTNARDAFEEKDSKASKIITLRSKLEKDLVIVEFKDNGIGISQENLDKLFDPFFTTKKVGKGTGLGLSISYGIIAEHKGKIKVSSIPGEGTIISVYLPNVELDKDTKAEKDDSEGRRQEIVKKSCPSL